MITAPLARAASPALLALAALGCAYGGVAVAEPLTFADTLARAAQSAPSLRAAALQVEASRSAARAADELPDPKLSIGVTDFPISGPLAGQPYRDDFSMVTLGFAQDVPSRDKRRARASQARAVITAGEAQRLVEMRKVRVAAALAWVDLYYAQRKLAALQILGAELKIGAATAPARLASGAVRPAGTLQPERDVAELEDRRETLRASLLKARADLGRWIGPAAEVEPTGPLPNPKVDATVLKAELDALPQLAVAEAAIRRTEADRGAAKADKRSDWGYEVEYAHRDPRFGDYVSGKLNFSLPLFTSARQDPIVAARTSDVARARADKEAARRELEAALEGELAEHAMHHALLARSREVLVPLARRRADLELASYQARTASLSDVLAARRARIDAELDALDREAEAIRDGVRLTLTYGEEPQ
ncbi:TolC family protein [soil metagenome]